jgi:hypothetical protein
VIASVDLAGAEFARNADYFGVHKVQTGVARARRFSIRVGLNSRLGGVAAGTVQATTTAAAVRGQDDSSTRQCGPG